MPPGAEARHLFRVLAGQSQAWADHMGRVVHWRQTFPIARPAEHFLLVRGAHILDASHFARVYSSLTYRNSRE